MLYILDMSLSIMRVVYITNQIFFCSHFPPPKIRPNYSTSFSQVLSPYSRKHRSCFVGNTEEDKNNSSKYSPEHDFR